MLSVVSLVVVLFSVVVAMLLDSVLLTVSVLLSLPPPHPVPSMASNKTRVRPFDKYRVDSTDLSPEYLSL